MLFKLMTVICDKKVENWLYSHTSTLVLINWATWLGQWMSASFLRFIFWKSELLGERENQKEKEIFRLLGYSSDGYNSQGWARQQPGASSCIQISHMSGKDPNTWHVFCCFSQAISRELNQKWSSQGINWCPYGMPATQMVTLPTKPQIPVPECLFLKDRCYSSSWVELCSSERHVVQV